MFLNRAEVGNLASMFKLCYAVLLKQRNLCLAKLQASLGECKDLANQCLKPIS